MHGSGNLDFVREFSAESFKTGYITAIGVLKVTLERTDKHSPEIPVYNKLVKILEDRLPHALTAFQMELIKMEARNIDKS